MSVRGARLLIAQHLDAGDDTVLAERESANAMVAGEAKRPRALAALHGRRILLVIIAGHQPYSCPTNFSLSHLVVAGSERQTEVCRTFSQRSFCSEPLFGLLCELWPAPF